MIKNEQEHFMKEALKEAKKAYEKLEVPVGAVIVKDGKIIARAHNLKETKYDTTKHAEILAIQKASKKLKSWRLTDCEMYITLEPCSMCAGALINSRIKKIYIGALDNKTGAASHCTLTSTSLSLTFESFLSCFIISRSPFLIVQDT